MAASALVRFLKSHSVVCMLLLTPGIPEYLSGSSPVNAIVLNPPQFLFQLAANLGLYGPGVLLIYEARLRWNKGWASVLLLGAAYGILEEGVALSTLFNPDAGPVGPLGQYGHWIGVNWVWVASILPVHMIYSISLPILLLGLVGLVEGMTQKPVVGRLGIPSSGDVIHAYKSRGFTMLEKAHGVLMAKELVADASFNDCFGNRFCMSALDHF